MHSLGVLVQQALLTRLDAVVTMVDALNAPRHLDLERETEVVPHVGELGFKETPAAADAHDAPDPNEVAEQIAFADELFAGEPRLSDFF